MDARTRANARSACSRSRPRSTQRRGPNREGRRPRPTFSATLRLPTSCGSWWTMLIPSACAARTSPSATGRPSQSSTPASGRRAPERMAMRVDLPAPFSPATAWTSLAARARVTSCRAACPPKRFEMPCTSRSGLVAGVIMRLDAEYTATDACPLREDRPAFSARRRRGKIHRRQPGRAWCSGGPSGGGGPSGASPRGSWGPGRGSGRARHAPPALPPPAPDRCPFLRIRDGPASG
jgi:hypothetical protein